MLSLAGAEGPGSCPRRGQVAEVMVSARVQSTLRTSCWPTLSTAGLLRLRPRLGSRAALGGCLLFFSFVCLQLCRGPGGGVGLGVAGCHTLQALLSTRVQILRFRKKGENPTLASGRSPGPRYSFPGLCSGALGAGQFIETAVFFHLATVFICLPNKAHHTEPHGHPFCPSALDQSALDAA